MNKITKFLAGSAVLLSATVALAGGEFGTGEEAKAMLAKAVENIKAGEAGALAEMQNGGLGSRDRDLYVFCAQAETGEMTVHPTLPLGTKLQDIVDKSGKKFGEEMMQVAKPDVIEEVSYVWPRPGEDTTPVEKVSFVTKITDQICGVGFYK